MIPSLPSTEFYFGVAVPGTGRRNILTIAAQKDEYMADCYGLGRILDLCAGCPKTQLTFCDR